MAERVSIALATYNGARHLGEQLDSYAAQTVLPDELVASDDGSTDETVDILRAFAENAPFDVRVLQGDRLGFAQNFGRAMAAATGDVVFLSDQDDAWERHKVERILEIDAPLVFHDLMLCDSSLRPSGQSMVQRLRLFGMGSDQHIKGCCSAVRRDLLEIALPIPEGIPHDSFLHALARETNGRVYVPERLIRYRIHETNTSSFSVNSLAPVTPWLRLKMSGRARWRRLRGQAAPMQPVRPVALQRLADRGVVTS